MAYGMDINSLIVGRVITLTEANSSSLRTVRRIYTRWLDER